MAMRVLDVQQGKIITVEDSEAQRGIAEGRYTPRAGVEIPVTKDGENFTVPSESLREAFGKGYGLRQRKEAEQIKQEAQMEVAGEMPVTAFAKNALSVSTFGASDIALAASGVERDFAQSVDEANPIAATAGQVTGAIAGSFVGPGAALARGTAQLGSKVATQIAPATGKFAGNVVGQMTNFGAEGLAYGFGQGISEAALGDPNEIASAIIFGGGLGAALGGGIGVGAPITKAVYSKLLSAGEKAVIASSEAALPAMATGAVRATAGKEAADRFGQIVKARNEDGTLAVKGLISTESAMEREAVETASAQFIKDTKDTTRELKDSIRGEVSTIKKELIDESYRYQDAASQLMVKRDELAAKMKAAKGEEKLLYKQQMQDLQGELLTAKQTTKAGQAVEEDATDLILNQLDQDIEEGSVSIFSSLNKHRDALDLSQKAMYTEAEEGLKNISLTDVQVKSATDYLQNLQESIEAFKTSPNSSVASVGTTLKGIFDKIADTNTLFSDDDLVRGVVQTRRALRDTINWRAKPNDYDAPLRAMYNETNKILDAMEGTVPQVASLRQADKAYRAMDSLNSTIRKHKSVNAVMKADKSPDGLTKRQGMNLAQKITKDPLGVESLNGLLDNEVLIATEAINRDLVASISDIKEHIARVSELQAQRAGVVPTGKRKAISESPEVKAVMSQIEALEKKGVAQISVDDLQMSDALKNDIKMNRAVRDSLRQRVGAMKGMSLDEAAEYVTDIANPGLGDRLDHYRRMKDALTFIRGNPSMNVLEKDLYLRKMLAADDEAIPLIERTLKDNNDLAFIQQFKRTEGMPATNVLAGGSILSGNPAMAMMTLAVGKAMDMARSPYGAIAALPVIESTARAGRKAMQAVGDRLGTALTSKPTARSVLAISNETKNYQERKKVVEENADIQVFSDRSAQALEALSGAPSVQFALMNKMQAAQDYLKAQLPIDPLSAAYLNPAQSRWAPTAQQMAKFNRVFEAVSNPAQAFDKFADGVITTEEVEAIKAVHPDIYQKMQEITFNTLTELKKPVDYQKRINLGIMFGIPSDPTLVPEYINYVQTMIGQYGKGDTKPTSNLKFDPETLLSDSQRISMR
jgi:hypothetical protein